jgi:hypothetical protein
MLRIIGWAWLLCCVAGAAARPDGLEPVQPTVEQLIERLGNREFKAREAAAKALAVRAEEALPAMRKAIAHPDPEVRQRLEQLVAETERAVLLAPKRITIKMENVLLKDALAELSRQSGYRVDLQGGMPQQVVSLEVKNATFWEALDKLSAQAGLVLQQHHDMQGGLILYAQNSITPFVDYRGPFRVWATGFHYNKSLTFGSIPRTQAGVGQRSEQMSFMFSVVAEPKLPLLGLGQPRLAAAIDDQDNSLVPAAAKNGVYETYHSGYYGYRNLVLQTQVQLIGPGAAARTMKLIKGALPVTLLAEQRAEITVDQILTVKDKKFEGKDVTLEIAEVKEAPGKTYQIVMTARRNGKDQPYDYTWTNSLHQRIELLDDKGQKFQSHGFNWINGTPTTVQGTFMFGDGGNAQLGKPQKLIYYGWVTMQHQVEFEFKDLPLP